MKWILPIVTALLLLGCGNEQNSTSASSVPQETKQSITAKAVTNTPIGGASLFAQKCAACHGQHAEKLALGKSQVIAGWESTKTVSALNGYKEGNYGGDMKALMQAQAKPLNDKQIEALAAYISTL